MDSEVLSNEDKQGLRRERKTNPGAKIPGSGGGW